MEHYAGLRGWNFILYHAKKCMITIALITTNAVVYQPTRGAPDPRRQLARLVPPKVRRPAASAPSWRPSSNVSTLEGRGGWRSRERDDLTLTTWRFLEISVSSVANADWLSMMPETHSLRPG
jgi:hypothetical protein